MAGHFGGNPYKWDFPATANTPHIARYMIARGFLYPWEIVLDAACATGYGSKLISLDVEKVIGYEVDPGCIDSALVNKPENCDFKVMDLNDCELPDVDACISIETMEHLTPEGLKHFVKQLHKHVRRVIIMTVPLGGTSHEYVNEPPGPATEKNDFMSADQVSILLAPEGSEWKELTRFQYGYSHIGIYFKDQPRVPKKWAERTGFLSHQYESSEK
jgi:SAM-dependent methyltransferase